MEELKAAIQAAAADGDWIIGEGWDQKQLGLPDERLLDRHDLDAICTSRPMALYRNCHHVVALNTLALQHIGLLSTTTDQFAAKPCQQLVTLFQQQQLQQQSSRTNWIPLDSDNNPTGLLQETACFALKRHLYERNDEATIKRFYLRGLYECMRKGITAVQSNDFHYAWSVYQDLNLPIRVYLTIPFDEIVDMHSEDEGYKRHDEVGTPLPDDECGLVSCHRVKLFADGSLGAKTAALRDPYADDECGDKCTHGNGMLIDSYEKLEEKIRFAHSEGYRLEVHAIGDKAAQVVLDAMQAAGVGPNDRPILTHCQVLGEDLLVRMKEMGVVANVQPSFVASDIPWIGERLGSNSSRLKYSYAWKTLKDRGIHTAGGSDAPVEDPNPLSMFRTARTIKSGEKPSTLPVFAPHERLEFKQAMHLYTQAAAFAAGEEDRLGQLKPGYRADFIVLDRDITQSSFQTGNDVDKTWSLLLDAQVEQVWVDGVQRFSSGADGFDQFLALHSNK